MESATFSAARFQTAGRIPTAACRKVPRRPSARSHLILTPAQRCAEVAIVPSARSGAPLGSGQDLAMAVTPRRLEVPMTNKNELDWLFMLYLSGDNNLSSEMAWTINEIGEAYKAAQPQEALRNRVAVTIQYDSLSPSFGPFLYALPHPAGYENEPDPGPIPFKEAFVHVLDKNREDAGDPRVLADFIGWSIHNYPSKHRMLVLSGHGSGAVGDFLTDTDPGDAGSSTSHVLRPEQQPGSLSIPGLSEALLCAREFDKYRKTSDPLIDVLGMDSCLMSTAEVCDQVREHVGYMVGSEGFVPNTGWPYRELLENLSLSPDIASLDPGKLCKRIVKRYIEYYRTYMPAGVSVDIAACELAKFDQLNRSVSALAERLYRRLDPQHKTTGRSLKVQNAVVMAHWRAQSFKFEQFTDLWDFCDQLMKVADQEVDNGEGEYFSEIVGCCRSVKDAVNAVVGRRTEYEFERQDFLGVEFQHAHGVSVYFPWQLQLAADRDYLKTYTNLRFAEGTGWANFLNAYLESTERVLRKRTRQESPSVTHEGVVSPSRNALLQGNHKYSSHNKYSSRNKSSSRNKFLIEQLGGMLPWSMKNPSQSLDLSDGGAPKPAVKVNGYVEPATTEVQTLNEAKV